MPRSSGVYSRVSGTPYVYDTDIDEVVVNSEMDDIAAALTQSIARDGQTTITANIPFNGNKITGLGAGTARTDAASLATIQDGIGVYVGTVGGTADVITLTPSPAITAYAAGQLFAFIASGANTTSVTVNVSGLGAKAITKNGTTALVAGDIPSGFLATIRYDGTRFQLVGAKDVFTGGALTSDITMSGASIIEAEGAAVTAAATTDIWATDGNTCHVTGNTTITSFGTAPQAGARMKLIFDGTPLLTQSANLNLNGGGANIQIEADDWADVYADTTTQIDVFVHRKSGKAIIETAPSLVILKMDNTFDGAVATGTATIPKDDTIPQNTEGTQFMSLAFTPVSASSTLLIEASIYISNSLAAQPTIAALFLSGTADAIGVGHMLNSNAAQPTLITLSAKIASGSTSAKTFTVRAGGSAASTVTFNGGSGARLFGGVFSSFIKVTEYI